METPEDVAVMLRLKGLGWGSKRIAFELGCSRNTVKRYLRRGAWVPYQKANRRSAFDGLEARLCERLRQHRGNADVVRQDLEREHGLLVSLRTVERTVCDFRRELEAEQRACVRFETPRGSSYRSILARHGLRSVARSSGFFYLSRPLATPGVGLSRLLAMSARAHGLTVWKLPFITLAASRRRC
jgi:hypothetical protein